jgi:hypothetical protein
MEKQLSLKPGVSLAHQEDRVGLSLNGRTCWAENATQAELLHALEQGPQCVNALTAVLCRRLGFSPDSGEGALLLAAFILNFGEFLEP